MLDSLSSGAIGGLIGGLSAAIIVPLIFKSVIKAGPLQDNTAKAGAGIKVMMWFGVLFFGAFMVMPFFIRDEFPGISAWAMSGILFFFLLSSFFFLLSSFCFYAARD